MGAERKQTFEAIVMELHILHSSPIAGIMHEPELVTCAGYGKEWESRILQLYSSYLLFSLAEADFFLFPEWFIL